jgi:hypothetical protein
VEHGVLEVAMDPKDSIYKLLEKLRGHSFFDEVMLKFGWSSPASRRSVGT